MDGGAQSPETNASSNSNSSSLLTEIVMIDETKGENGKDVSFGGRSDFPPTKGAKEMMEESPATDCR